ncbi:FAD-dependent monooxygenase [Specibacter cremeus]|uniref:FAD-dependent monooxygenase n=1 Tax=Specibacter cremeus TaxID=1629051 RepID=UPI000F7B88BE|nr:FAD-dependent monooxygenase [Specibacter cremeus]
MSSPVRPRPGSAPGAVICGAGISGLAAAAFLARAGWDVSVVDHAPGPRTQGYMIDFFGPGWQAAGELGVLATLRERGYRVPRVDYVDATGKPTASLPVERLSAAYADRLTSIMRPDIELTLREALPGNVRLRYGTTVTAVSQDAHAVTATLSDGSTETADLLVGADGVHSQIRALAFGPEADFMKYLGFHVAAFKFHDPRLAALVTNRYAVTDTRNESLFFYALRDGTVSVMAVCRNADAALPADPRTELRRRCARLAWIRPQALDECPGDVYYDQVAQIVMPRWRANRVIMLGDAAGAVSLLAGQGASLGMAGAFVLADELARAGAGGRSVQTALAAFEDRWHPRVLGFQKTGAAAAQWFVPATPLASWMRRAAIKATAVPLAGRLVGTAVVGKAGAAL